jgi:Fur family transcriptional regulator, ferric uptake regulator
VADSEDRLEAIRCQVRARGRRWTIAKSVIVEVLLDAPGHLSARHLHAAVPERFPQIEQSTIYRALRTLAEEDVVHAFDRRGEARYGLSDRPHHHAVCGGCGQDAEIPAAAISGLLDAAAERTGFRFDGESLTVVGRCPSCEGDAPAG